MSELTSPPSLISSHDTLKPVLHWLWRDPSTDPLLSTCLSTVADQDCVVLMGEAALAAIDPDRWLKVRRGQWLVLLPDLVTQGFNSTQVSDQVSSIDHAGLVELACRFPLVQNWA